MKRLESSWPGQYNHDFMGGFPIGSLLSLDENRALMVVEVFCCDQTLPRKLGSRPT
jgi:hypothetical protein